jgi:hypothetical protein
MWKCRLSDQRAAEALDQRHRAGAGGLGTEADLPGE